MIVCIVALLPEMSTVYKHSGGCLHDTSYGKVALLKNTIQANHRGSLLVLTFILKKYILLSMLLNTENLVDLNPSQE